MARPSPAWQDLMQATSCRSGVARRGSVGAERGGLGVRRSRSQLLLACLALAGLARCECVVGSYEIARDGGLAPFADVGQVDMPGTDAPGDAATASDGATSDGATSDGAVGDAIGIDAPVDAAETTDASALDVATGDSAGLDAGLEDAATVDSSAALDATELDAAAADAQLADSALPDTSLPDLSLPDLAAPDYWGVDVCIPDCAGKCGSADDGCGSSCGDVCPLGQWCDVDSCLPCDSAQHCGVAGVACSDCAASSSDLTCVDRSCGCLTSADHCALGEWCGGSDLCLDCDSDQHCGGAGASCVDCSAQSKDRVCVNRSCGCTDAALHCLLGEWCDTAACAVCDDDAHCGQPGQACVSCADQATDKACVNRSCGCSDDDDCALGQWCSDNSCVDCSGDLHCGDVGLACEDCTQRSSGIVCVSRACGCSDAAEHCLAGEWCEGGLCAACTDSAHCGPPGGPCVDCSAQAIDTACVDRACGCTDAAQHCAVGQTCGGDQCQGEYDQCAYGTDDCDFCTSSCNDIGAGWTCPCLSGFSHDGVACASTDEGALVVGSGNANLSTDVVSAYRSCADGVSFSVVGLGATTATLSEAPADCCLNRGDEVLLLSLRGSSDSVLHVGDYELLRVASVDGATVSFQSAKTASYGTGAGDDLGVGVGSGEQRVALIRVPTYTDVTVASGATLSSAAWDGLKGGVLALRATGAVDIGGTVSMAGKGYRGGARSCGSSMARAQQGESYPGLGLVGSESSLWALASEANGGGGGGGCFRVSYCDLSGAGGGHGTAGETFACNCGGDCVQSCIEDSDGGGSYGAPDLGAGIFLGSGGGGGGYDRFKDYPNCHATAGAPGGGIIMIWTDTLTVSGDVDADGAQAANPGSAYQPEAGGGGSGGSVLLSATTSLDMGSLLVTTRGGPAAANPSNTAAGGDGRIMATVSGGSPTGVSNPAAYVP